MAVDPNIDANTEIYPMDYQALLDGTLPLPQLLADIHKQNIGSPNGKLKRTFDAVKEGLRSPELQKHPRHATVSLIIDTVAEDYEQNPTLAKVRAVKGPRLDKEAPQAILPRGQKPQLWTVSRLLTEQLAKSKTALDDAFLISLKSLPTSKDPLEISVDEDCPHLVESLAKIQAALGPIKSLIVVARPEQEETEEKESESSVVENPQLVQAISQCQELETLDIAGVTLTFSKLNWPTKLLHLDIQDTDIEKDTLQTLAKTCTKLKTLFMHGCNKMTLEDMLLVDYPSLEEFSYTPLWADEMLPENEPARISQLLKQHAQNPVVLTILAETILEAKNPLKKPAADMLVEALKANPHCLRARATLAELMRKGAQDVKPDEAESLSLIEQSLDINRYHLRSLACRARHLINSDKASKQHEAHELARQLYNKAPNDDFILATYAYCHWKVDRTDLSLERAQEWVDRALELNPRSYYALTVKAEIGKKDETWDCANLAFEINPYDESNLITYVDELLETEDKDDEAEAVQVLQNAIKSHDTFAMGHVKLAEIAIKTTPQAAKAHYENALRIDPNCFEALVGLAEIYTTIDDERKVKLAIILYEKALAQKPEDIKTITGLSECLLDESAEEMSNSARAQQLLLQAYKIAPEDASVLGLLGETYLLDDNDCEFDSELGIQYLQEAIEKKSNVAWHLLKLAEYYTNHSEDGSKAEELYEEAFKLDPQNEAIRISYAKFWLKSFTENDPPDFDKAAEMLAPLLAEEAFQAKAAILQAQILLLRDAEKNKEEAVGFVRQALAEQLLLPSKKMLSELLTDYPTALAAVRSEIIKALAT